MKAATEVASPMHEGEEFQSTPPVKAATRPALATLPQAIFQSTPPVKAATLYAWNQYDYVEISIHAAREGGDFTCACLCKLFKISIHAAREGGDAIAILPSATSSISIHAAREGGDSPAASMVLIRAVFQSTPPVKAATVRIAEKPCGYFISIHAAREGGDINPTGFSTAIFDFNPRRP